MSTDRTKRLGRGLEALLTVRPDATMSARPAETGHHTGAREIPVAAIRANPLQPRKTFADAELSELEASIRSSGLLQPVIVRPAREGFELIAGERRLRAVQRLGWRDIPAIVREIDDRGMLTLALIENLQRTDLNPIEEAEGFQELMAQFALTQQEVAEVVGKDRSTVANTLRLLGLPTDVRRMVREGELSIGHARTLLGLADEQRMLALARVVVADGLSVREVERRVRDQRVARSGRSTKASGGSPRRPPEVPEMEHSLRRHFQTDVRVHLTGANRGEVRLAFYSADDLERLLDLLLGAEREVH